MARRQSTPALAPYIPPGLKPTKRTVAVYPDPTPRAVPFFPLYDEKGEPLPWMRAGSPIDAQPGVYILFDRTARKYYVGSSVANVRRTVARHFQAWQRPRPLSQYVTKFRGAGARMSPRRATVAAVFLVPLAPLRLYEGARRDDNEGPRQVEAWIYQRLCSAHACRGINDLADVPF